MIQPIVLFAARTSALALGALVLAAPMCANVQAADLPMVKTNDDNAVAACATPGRLMAFTRARNEKLDPKFNDIATEYMRHGEALGIRWDIAYFQMLVETGNLKFGGDVRPTQNNFAGLGATGNGEHGETFKDVSTGARAHLEHLLMYAGDPVANPVAERTRKVQEWGVLTDWQKSIKGPMTFTLLARKWAPSTRKYAAEIASVTESFMDGACKGNDPNPEMVASAREGRTDPAVAAPVTTAEAKPIDKKSKKTATVNTAAVMAQASSEPSAAPAADPDKVSGLELARRAVEQARSEGTATRTGLGAASLAKGAAVVDDPKASETKPSEVALVTPLKPEITPDAPAAEAAEVSKTAASGVAKGAKPAVTTPTKTGACKVFTASYGGTKAVVIKAVTDQGVHYTVLDVNEGSESREAEAYIQAYAPGGKQLGEFPSEAKALDKAFDLCPEG